MTRELATTVTDAAVGTAMMPATTAGNAQPGGGASPPAGPGATGPGPAVPGGLNRRQKAAVIVRLLLAEGGDLPLAALPEDLQAALTEQMGRMHSVDRATLERTIGEFTAALERVGLTFPGWAEGAIGLMDGHISADAASRVRRLAGAGARADPWTRITALPDGQLLPLLSQESPEVAAVILGKMPVARAAEMLGQLPGDRARRIAYAISRTAAIAPRTVERIGHALVGQFEATPPRAFEAEPGERIGAILNVSAPQTRETVLQGLEETDAAFARSVRRAIFTYPQIPARIEPRDIPKIVRAVEQDVLVRALAAEDPGSSEASAFILENMSQRMAGQLREEISDRGAVKPKEADEAMTAVIAAIRTLEAADEIALIQPEEASGEPG